MINCEVRLSILGLAVSKLLYSNDVCSRHSSWLDEFWKCALLQLLTSQCLPLKHKHRSNTREVWRGMC